MITNQSDESVSVVEHSGNLEGNNKEVEHAFMLGDLDMKTSLNIFDENNDDSTRSRTYDESSCEETEPPCPIVCNDDMIWDPPEAENEDDNREYAFFDDDDEYVDDEGTGWAEPVSLNDFREGVSSSNRFKEEKDKAIQEVMNGKFKSLVSQLLKSFGIQMSDGSWVDTVTLLAWQAASFLKLDTSDGKAMNPADYVKIKCLASGSPSESRLIKGLVFKKQVAHRHMATEYKNPRLLLVQGMLDQSPGSSRLSSFHSVMEQCRDNIVADLIENLKACNPNVILVERSVSRHVIETILKLGVTLVLDMKLHRLERVSHCTGSRIVSSDSTFNGILRQCDSIYFERFVEEHAIVCEGQRKPSKTLMFLEGCPTRLGCTILLKGSHTEELKKIKHVVKRAVLMAYSFILETSFLVDRKVMLSTIAFDPDGHDGGESEAQTVVPVLPTEEANGSTKEDKQLDNQFGSTVECERKVVDDGDYCIREKDEIGSVLDSESILVLMSSRNTTRGTICEQSHLSHIKFYGDLDIPLWKFLQDHLSNQSPRCKACEEPPEAHFFYYAHNHKQLTVQVNRLGDTKLLPGDVEGKLWMWSRGKCEPYKGKATKRVLVSTPGLSFGKFLKLCLSSHSSFDRLSSCGHSFQKDFLDFFGLGSTVAMVQYSRVATYKVFLPTPKLEFNSSTNRDWLLHEIESVYSIGTLLFTEIANLLKKLESQFSGLPKTFAEILDMLNSERSEFEDNMKNVKIKTEGCHYSVHTLLSLNRLRGEILLEASVWEQRLQLLLSSRGWVWKHFSEIRDECMKYLHKDYLPNFGYLPKCEQQQSSAVLPKVSQVISEEGSRLHFPVGNGDYVVSDYDGEISSPIACSLALMKDLTSPDDSTTLKQASFKPFIEPRFSRFDSLNLLDSSVSFGPLNPFNPHPEVNLGIEKGLPKGKYSVVIMYANEFQGLRSRCCTSELDYIASLSRCKIWNAKGGKSKTLFAKTLDDRLIIKEIKKTELDSFMEFAPKYFDHLKETFQSGYQTCLAKILGIYQVVIRHPRSGKETKHDLMVQENLFFGRNITRHYDLKGVLHARFTAPDGSGDVLLDQNFVNDMNSSPMYVGQKAKRLLQRAVFNDTLFLHSINVTDYSLLVGVDKRELICGIIDYLTEYTLDKQFKTWVNMQFVTPKNMLPIIISPKEFKKRFRKFVDTHFLVVPDHW